MRGRGLVAAIAGYCGVCGTVLKLECSGPGLGQEVLRDVVENRKSQPAAIEDVVLHLILAHLILADVFSEVKAVDSLNTAGGDSLMGPFRSR